MLFVVVGTGGSPKAGQDAGRVEEEEESSWEEIHSFEVQVAFPGGENEI